MKQRNKNTCPEEWMIQAFIDGELDGEEYSGVKNHIATCEVCQKRVESRRIKVNNVLENFDQPLFSKHVPQKTRLVKLAAWGSIAASILIAVGIGFWFMQADTKNNEIPPCEWVVLNEAEFNPLFESPNKLYNKRLIEIKEVDATGNVTLTYLEKHCNN